MMAFQSGRMEDGLEAKVQLIWEQMCRDPPATGSWEEVIERDDIEQDRMSDSSSDGIVIATEHHEPSEPPDLSIWANEPYSDNELAIELVECAKDAENHLKLMDSKIQDLLTCTFPSWKKSESKYTHTAVSIIDRLPRSSLRLSRDLWATFDTKHSQYIIDTPHDNELSMLRTSTSTRSCWERYRVTTEIDSNSIRLALITAYLDQTSHRGVSQLADYANILSRILDSLTELEASHKVKGSHQLGLSPYQVARAFIWTVWQRSQLISLYYLFGTRLRREWNRESWYPKEPEKYEELKFSVHGSSLQTEVQTDQACQYMCRHPFELLRLSSSGTRDFRTLIARYSNQFGDRGARCYQQNSEWLHCESKTGFCSRCNTASPKNQSAHDMACHGSCRRIIWDEDSYRGVKGPRCIDISFTQPGNALKYRRASRKTLAVSHVWSHGQGGRPEEGFNECLHKRYATIARDHDCDSYWIDAACIPLDAGLRSEAIKTINPIFRESKVTLICDKDIMTVDVRGLSVQQCEILISILLLSDWNIRAWTLLEVVRGNRAVHLLCKNNVTVPLKSVLQILYEHRSLDLCAILIGSPHLLPLGSETDRVGIEEAGAMLSRRYASRPGDDIIIWSLLCGNDAACTKPEALWNNRLGGFVNTGFLVSSCKRVEGLRGLSWAPAKPCAEPIESGSKVADTSASGDWVYWPYSGVGTNTAKIAGADGTITQLQGNWFVYNVEASAASQFATSTKSCWGYASQLLSKGYRRVLFLRPILAVNYVMQWGHPFAASQHLDEGKQKQPVAICATRDNWAEIEIEEDYFQPYTGITEFAAEEWEWKGVYSSMPDHSFANINFECRWLKIV
ncbi:hypothetical protein F4818DRAFT_452781 [Hypoxylon cercidicola]|nr:hypothetical protein F4818DRAFT_452781 [Hypoxylon cercidicola]